MYHFAVIKNDDNDGYAPSEVNIYNRMFRGKNPGSEIVYVPWLRLCRYVKTRVREIVP